MNYYEFICTASETGVDTKETRQQLLRLFHHIHDNVECAHCVADPLHISHDLLTNQHLTGPILEMGCFKGGMTCKLSHVAALLGRKLCVFDTFEGLPETAHYRTSEFVPKELGRFEKGQFACSLEDVKANVSTYGRLDCCEFYPGRIEDTLPYFADNPSLVFIDVDLVPTAQFIIRQLWHRIQNNKLFTHEGCIEEYMNNMRNQTWWTAYFRTERPQMGSEVLQTAFGLPGSNCLDYFIKP